MLLRISLLTLIAWSMTMQASADSCLLEFTSLDVIEKVQAGSARNFQHPLKSKNVNGIFETRVVLEGKFDGQLLNLTVRFPANGVSLPYNIYLLAAGTEKQMMSWQDLTSGCTAPGRSIFPGQASTLDAIKLPHDAGSMNLHLILWGRL